MIDWTPVIAIILSTAIGLEAYIGKMVMENRERVIKIEQEILRGRGEGIHG